MRRLLLAFAGATALATTSVANAAITIGTTGTNSGVATAIVTDNVNNPNKVEFDTTNAAGGGTSVTSFFNFMVSGPMVGVFSATTATNPASTVSLLELLLGSTVIASSTGSSNSLSLTSGTLTAGNAYTFRYTARMADGGGNISGPASFYAVAVPEPATWGLMLLGFGGIGMVLRRRRRPTLAQVA